MKLNSKLAFVAGVISLFSVNAMAAHIPSEIYKPFGGKLVKADRQGNGEFEVEYRLDARRTNIPSLAKKVITHARSKGFRLEESEISRDDADLKFERGNQELDVEIELKDHGRIEYKADLDLDKN